MIPRPLSLIILIIPQVYAWGWNTTIYAVEVTIYRTTTFTRGNERTASQYSLATSLAYLDITSLPPGITPTRTEHTSKFSSNLNRYIYYLDSSQLGPPLKFRTDSAAFLSWTPKAGSELYAVGPRVVVPSTGCSETWTMTETVSTTYAIPQEVKDTVTPLATSSSAGTALLPTVMPGVTTPTSSFSPTATLTHFYWFPSDVRLPVVAHHYECEKPQALVKAEQKAKRRRETRLAAIVFAVAVPILGVLGVLENYFWFTRLMKGGTALRCGTVAWSVTLVGLVAVRVSRGRRARREKVEARERWKKLSYREKLGLWRKWGFRWKYPEVLLGPEEGRLGVFGELGRVRTAELRRRAIERASAARTEREIAQIPVIRRRGTDDDELPPYVPREDYIPPLDVCSPPSPTFQPVDRCSPIPLRELPPLIPLQEPAAGSRISDEVPSYDSTTGTRR